MVFVLGKCCIFGRLYSSRAHVVLLENVVFFLGKCSVFSQVAFCGVNVVFLSGKLH